MKKKNLSELNTVKPRTFKTIQKEVELKPWDSVPLEQPLAVRDQSVSNGAAKPLAMSDHSAIKALAELSRPTESVSIPSPNTLAEPLAMSDHSAIKALAVVDLDSLVGKEKALLLFVFKKCQSLGSRETSLITTEELRESLSVSAERLRNLIFRLCQKKALTVSQVKNGRSGWRKFLLSSELFQQLYLRDSASNTLPIRDQSVSNEAAKPLAEPLAGPPSSSSLRIKTTTEDWEPFRKFKEELGFSQQHLDQVLNDGTFNAEQVKASLDAFIFDLKKGAVKPRKTPLEYIMGVLRRQKTPYVSAIYKDEDEILLEELNQRLEARKKLLNQKKAAVFQKWFELERSENENQLLAQVPPVGSKYGVIHQEMLQKFFEEHVMGQSSNS